MGERFGPRMQPGLKKLKKNKCIILQNKAMPWQLGLAKKKKKNAQGGWR